MSATGDLEDYFELVHGSIEQRGYYDWMAGDDPRNTRRWREIYVRKKRNATLIDAVIYSFRSRLCIQYV